MFCSICTVTSFTVLQYNNYMNGRDLKVCRTGSLVHMFIIPFLQYTLQNYGLLEHEWLYLLEKRACIW